MDCGGRKRAYNYFIAAQSNIVNRPLSKEDAEWATNMIRYYSEHPEFTNPQPWPEAAQQQVTLKKSAAVLRSAIDTNEIELACARMTSQPEAAVSVKNFARVAMSNLDECAAAFESPELTTSMSMRQGRYWAQFSNFSFEFWTTNSLTSVIRSNRLPTVIRSIDMRLPDTERIMGARFYESGKLEFFSEISRDSNGAIKSNEGFTFKEDGKFDYHWMDSK